MPGMMAPVEVPREPSIVWCVTATSAEDLTEIDRGGRRCAVCSSGRQWRRFEVVRPEGAEPVVMCSACRTRYGSAPPLRARGVRPRRTAASPARATERRSPSGRRSARPAASLAIYARAGESAEFPAPRTQCALDDNRSSASSPARQARQRPLGRARQRRRAPRRDSARGREQHGVLTQQGSRLPRWRDAVRTCRPEDERSRGPASIAGACSCPTRGVERRLRHPRRASFIHKPGARSTTCRARAMNVSSPRSPPAPPARPERRVHRAAGS
jgi:hypothetical protein